MFKYNTYEIYKCEKCGIIYRLPLHNRNILPEGHVWTRKISMEREEGIVRDPLAEVVV